MDRRGDTATREAFEAEVREQLDEVIEHFNDSYDDTVLLLARHGAGLGGVTDASLVGLDPHGADLVGSGPGGERRGRLHFVTPARTAGEVQGHVLDWIATARRAAGDASPLTSLERELAAIGTARTYHATVHEVRALSANLQRVVLAGNFDGLPAPGGDQFVFVMVDRPDRDPVVDDAFGLEDFQRLPEDRQPAGAYYTVRRFDAARSELELWIVTHGDALGVGGWSRRARPGDAVALWGPRTGHTPPAEQRAHLLVADESGLAAVAALLDWLPPEHRVDVIAEVTDRDHQLALPARSVGSVTWLHRGAAEAGVGDAMLQAVRRLGPGVAAGCVFGAGESRQVTAIRGYLRRELGMPREQVSMTGYWRRSSAADHD